MATQEKSSTATVTVSDTSLASEEAIVRPERRLRQAVWAIVGGVALPCIPILLITSVLLYVVFHYRLDLSGGLPELALFENETHRTGTTWLSYIRHQGGDGAYYVDYNPSTITTIASWTSRVIPYLSSSIMALVAFFAARHIVLKSKRSEQHESNLPTPDQLSLLINMLNGSSFGPLKDALVHRYRRKEKLISPLPAAFSALFFITMLGLVIPVVDSWFGIATKPWTVQQLTPKSSNFSSFGRGLSRDTCPTPKDNGQSNSNNPFHAWWPCNVYPINGHGPFFMNLYDSLTLLYGTSKQHQIHNYTDEKGTEFLYLGGANQDGNIDFKAKTYGTSSQCVPMTQLCFSNFAAGGSYLFNCTPAFSGNLYQTFLNSSATLEDAYSLPPGSSVGVAFAGNPELTEAGGQTFIAANAWAPGESLDLGQNVTQIYPTNPIYYGAWANRYPAANIGGNASFVGDTGIFWNQDVIGGGIWMFNCSTTVWEIDYTWVNGSVHNFNRTLASPDMGGLLSGIPAFASQEGVIQNTINEAATLAAYSGNSSRAIADRFGREISKTMIAFSVAAMEPKLNILEQVREPSKIVARIPFVPFYLLLATKALYVLAVIILAIGAYCFTHPAETEVVKAQLSIKGLTAAHFNQPSMMQENVVRDLQDRLDAAHGKAQEAKVDISEEEPRSTSLRHAATEPVHGVVKPIDNARVGLLPTVDGSWEFVLLANGVWNSLKPMVKTFILQEASSGGLGEAGKVINAWH